MWSTSQAKFWPKKPVTNVSGKNTVARTVSRSIVAFCRMLIMVCSVADHGQVGLQDGAEQVALGGHLLVDQQQMVLHVAHVGRQFARRPWPARSCRPPTAADAPRGRSRSPRGAASRSVRWGPRCRRTRSPRPGRCRVRGRRRPGCTRRPPGRAPPTAPTASPAEQLRALFEAGPGARQLAGDALPDGDHERRPDEDADLAEVDLLARVVVARRTQDDQPHVALVVLDLGPQVEGLGVLDGQFVQPETPRTWSSSATVGLEQAEPDEPALGAAGRSLVQRDRTLRPAGARPGSARSRLSTRHPYPASR